MSSSILPVPDHLDDAIARLDCLRTIQRWAERFPHRCDERLTKAFQQIMANSSGAFLRERSSLHARRLIFCVYFLQKKIEECLSDDPKESHLFLKLFREPGRLCVAFAFSEGYGFQRESLKKTLNTLLPGFNAIPGSFFSWHHPKHPYLLWYLELKKIRGKEPSLKELKQTERFLCQQLMAKSPLTPTLFWPYNKEDSYRRIQTLQKELLHKHDLPHITVHLLEQTTFSLEFLIYLVRPKQSVSLTETLYRLPESLLASFFFHYETKDPFPVELAGFSLKVSADIFDTHDSINLLHARRYILKHLEDVIGTFRDFNGGLFEKQQQQFEEIRFQLCNKIANFDLFAERLFYALHPRESWLSLTLSEIEDLFAAFAELLHKKGSFLVAESGSGKFTILKSSGDTSVQRKIQQIERVHQLDLCAQLTIGRFYYRCYFGAFDKNLLASFQGRFHQKKGKVLRLIFQEGSPPSLNPHYSNGDIRCRVIHKLLFEGLTRLNRQGLPELAGALHCHLSDDGLSYTFKLRPTFWSTGEKVRALDYETGMRCGLNQLVPHPEFLFMIKHAQQFKNKTSKELGVRVVDAETLRIDLDKPDPCFLHRLSQPSFAPLLSGEREPTWFNGPFLVREHTKKRLLLERNPYFWDTKRVQFEAIEVKWMSDADAIYAMYQKGETDWIGEPFSVLTTSQIDDLKEQGSLIQQTMKRCCSAYFNTKNIYLSSPSIRKALSLVIDRNKIVESIYKYSEPYPSQANPWPLARALLAQGLEQLGHSLQEPPLLILTYSTHTRRKDLALYLQQIWQQLGVRVGLEECDWNAFRTKLEKRDFQICVTIQDTLMRDSFAFYDRMEGQSSWNFSQWNNARYRTILEEGGAEWQSSLERILQEEAPFSPLFEYTHLIAHHNQLRNYWLDAEGCVDLSRAFFELNHSITSSLT